MKCQKEGCNKPIIRLGMKYCSKRCAPLAHYGTTKSHKKYHEAFGDNPRKRLEKSKQSQKTQSDRSRQYSSIYRPNLSEGI